MKRYTDQKCKNTFLDGQKYIFENILSKYANKATRHKRQDNLN